MVQDHAAEAFSEEELFPMARRSFRALTGAVVASTALMVGVAACGDDNSSSGSSTGTSGGDTSEITLKVAYVTTAQHPYGLSVAQFAKDVAAASDGRIKIVPQPSYPQAEVQLLSDVRGGSVDMATISTAVWDSAGINSFQALQAPFLVTDYGLDGKILEGDIGKAMAKDASDQAGDITVLAIHEGGMRKPIGAKKPLNSLAAFKGAKIRASQSKVMATGLRSLGAEADPIPLPEVYQALQNGTFDGMEANLGLVATNKYYEVAKYVTGNVNLWPFPTALTVNNGKFKALSEEDQKIITDAAAKMPAQSIELFAAPSKLPQQLVDCGMTFSTASPADLKAMQQKAQSAYAQLSKDPTTGEFIKQIEDLKKAQPAGAAPPPLPTKKAAACALG